jgi:uncharacterized protein (TIGR02246 family)
MGAQEEIEALTNEWISAFNRGQMQPFLDALADDLEVLDTVPYRFDDKASFVEFLQGSTAGLESVTFGFRQPSYRVFNDNVGIVNAYDMFSAVAKNGAVTTNYGRTTLVYVKQGGQWKIVSAHFSALPKS